MMVEGDLAALEHIDPTVGDVLRSSSTERLRRIAIAAVEQAMQAGFLPLGSVLDRARAALESRRFGESPERRALGQLVEQLDEAAWDIQDEVDAARVPYEDYRRAFRRARAANCLWCALDDDPLAAAAQALYEAHSATGRRGTPKDVVESVN